jgi:hypothetical protein
MSKTDSNVLPVACNLNDPAFQRRRAELMKRFAAGVQETKEIAGGYRYLFPPDGNWIAELAQLISVERECCPFLRFKLEVEPANGPVSLELTGPEGTKDFLKFLLES